MILDILYVFSLATLAAAALTNVAGVNLYDAKQVKRQSHQIKHPHAKPYRIRPLVSIIVTGHETYLEECLNSLAKLKYKNVEIIVSITQPTKSSKKIVG
jgi:cellulose synthase/poly-beta-1,6-N-acetylglucosamine synthase-like glycosyltransferase